MTMAVAGAHRATASQMPPRCAHGAELLRAGGVCVSCSGYARRASRHGARCASDNAGRRGDGDDGGDEQPAKQEY